MRRAVAALAWLSTIALIAGCTAAPGPVATETSRSAPSSTASQEPPATAAAPTPSSVGRVVCPAATTKVSTAKQLQDALSSAAPGDSIALADGTYKGAFVAQTSGSASQPIFLCGSRSAIVSGTDIKKGYALHLMTASYWRLVGFSVVGAQKGVVLDSSNKDIISGLSVSGIGDEGIHLRTASSDNLVEGNVVTDTGNYSKKFGEGIYIGSAKSNWCTYSSCGPDKSDRNVIRGNTISATGAENVDIKEGTSDGQLIGNSFDGAGMTGGDSWVDVKGDGWLIQDNTGKGSPNDGYQTHVIVSGWGDRNIFRDNVSDVGADGYAINVTKPLSNIVSCSNTETGAAKGLTNITCT
jgi:parallel beta-helix repeat protein